MALPLAVGQIAVGVVVVLGIVAVLVGNMWTLVVAAQRGVLWFIALFILPLVGLILLFVEPKSRPPFLVAMVGIVMVIGGAYAADSDVLHDGKFVEGVVKSLQDGRRALERRFQRGHETLETRKERIRQWKLDLEAKRAALKPGDRGAQAAFDQELQEYLQDLEAVKAEMAESKP